MRADGFALRLAAVFAMAFLATMPAYAQTSIPSTPTPAPTGSAPPSLAIPFATIAADLSPVDANLDAATARALELEAEIATLDDDNRALNERIAVTAARVVEQRATVDAAETAFAEATTRYRRRLVEVYKHGTFDPLMLLLSADDLAELISRAGILSRIAEDDSRLVADLNLTAAEARYQQNVLSDLQAQDRALVAAQEARATSLTALLAEQEALVAQLTIEAREAILKVRASSANTRQQWKAASIPVGSTIPRATASVDSRPGLTYLVSAYMPRAYRSSGQVYSAVCSWYGPGFNGRNSASGQTFNEDDFTCASRTLPFGTVLALTRGDRRIIVYVNDRGPYIDGRDLDLSKAAASALGFGGVATVSVEIVVPAQ